MPDSHTEPVFLFNLNLVTGGFAYFSASTIWCRTADRGREIRKPSADVSVEVATSHIEKLGQFAFFIDSSPAYEHWLLRRGWAFVARDFGQTSMQQWLAQKTCVKSALNTYTDVDICADGALARFPRGQKRAEIVERDSNCCLLCGKSGDDQSEMTIHHVRAHSRGGESSATNMVILCTDCNQRVGTDHLTELYDLAGIPHGYDFSLLRAEKSFAATVAAMQFSDNMMHTRCEVW